MLSRHPFFFWLAVILSRRLLEQDGLNIRQHTGVGYDDFWQQPVEFLVASDRELYAAGIDPFSFVVPGRIAAQFENFSDQILQNCRQVNWGARCDAFGVLSQA